MIRLMEEFDEKLFIKYIEELYSIKNYNFDFDFDKHFKPLYDELKKAGSL